MSDGLIAFFAAASLSAVAYSQLGKRVGYSNTQQVRSIVAIAFVFCFVIFYTLFRFVLHIS
ncbi:MAG TPA: hypothetical protein VGF75_07370 [Candidatus Saccharimonadales bacterium]|jgi:hypothetical protein